jgi:hypothetical protein
MTTKEFNDLEPDDEVIGRNQSHWLVVSNIPNTTGVLGSNIVRFQDQSNGRECNATSLDDVVYNMAGDQFPALNGRDITITKQNKLINVS